jgi:ACR3 family arsenite efflux pump ArsB
MPLLLVLFVVVAFLLAVLLLMEAGEVVSLPRGLSTVLLYLLYFSLFAMIATTHIDRALGLDHPERRGLTVVLYSPKCLEKRCSANLASTSNERR